MGGETNQNKLGGTELCGIGTKNHRGDAGRASWGEVGLKERFGGLCNSQEGPGSLHGVMEVMKSY